MKKRKTSSQGNPKKKRPTKRQIEKKNEDTAAKLFSRITDGDLTGIMEKVGWVLNHSTSARNSDITCLIQFWKEFEPDIIKGEVIYLKDLYKHTPLTSVVRARAKIQNEYNLFLASEEVRKRRGKLEEGHKEWALEERPDCDGFTIYFDESGKTGKQLILSSLWVMDVFKTASIFTKIMELRERRKFKHEFHFSELNEGTQDAYKELIDILYEHSGALSFKYCIVENSGIADYQEAIQKLMYHLIIDGIRHESESGRAPLPRSLQVIKDYESAKDKFLMKELKDRVSLARNAIFEGKVYLDEFKAIPSNEHFLLQVVDMSVGCINRIINKEGTKENAKDRIAKYFFAKFGIDLSKGDIKPYDDIVADLSF